LQAQKFEKVLQRKATIKRQKTTKNKVDYMASNEADKDLDDSTDPYDTVHSESGAPKILKTKGSDSFTDLEDAFF